MAGLWFHHRLNILMIWHKDRVFTEFIKSCRLPVQWSIYVVSLGWIKVLTWEPSYWILLWQAGKKKCHLGWCFCKLQFKRKKGNTGVFILLFSSKKDLHFQRQFTQCQSAWAAKLSITVLFLLQGKEKKSSATQINYSRNLWMTRSSASIPNFRHSNMPQGR